jgi:hypothetical protein
MHLTLLSWKDIATLAQPGPPARAGFARVGVECNRRLLRGEIGLPENTIQTHLLLPEDAWLIHSFRFPHTPCLPRPGLRDPGHNGHGARPETLLRQNRRRSANSEAIHF